MEKFQSEVCVRACVRACVRRACVRVRVHVVGGESDLTESLKEAEAFQESQLLLCYSTLNIENCRFLNSKIT